ncbi:hypothetical protein Nm8I071_26900 [Nonomuraea sp. TT08I-71]|nr:hypothetical protein Nm8I071_26900 [Nonomuraea sp. TT08I-71]
MGRLRFTKATGTWMLFWRDHNDRFHRYDPVPPSADIAVLLAELDRDPPAIFWG